MVQTIEFVDQTLKKRIQMKDLERHLGSALFYTFFENETV